MSVGVWHSHLRLLQQQCQMEHLNLQCLHQSLALDA